MNCIDWVLQNKPISGNTECPVFMENILENEYYCQCSECNYNIHFNVIQKIKINSNLISCPMCRSVWKNESIYRNANLPNHEITTYKTYLRNKFNANEHYFTNVQMVTEFKVIYKRHTNFSIETEK